MKDFLNTRIKEEDGKLHVHRWQDVQAILDYNKEKQIAGTKAHSEMRHVGQIPLALAEDWSRQCGAKIGSREFGEYVKKKLMSGEFSKLVVHGY